MTAEYAWVRSSVAKLALAAAFVAFGSASAFAAAVTYEHVPERNTSFISHHTVGGPVLADDFDPAVGVSGGVTFVEWWGSRATSDSWEVTLHLGSGVGGPIPSVPAAIPAFTGGTKYFVTSAGVETAPGSGIFYFSAALPGDFFVTQQPNLEDDYWFSAANFSDGWTWALAGAGPTVGDEHWHAVSSVGSTPCPDGGPHCGAWSELEGQDLAFRISVTPAPEPMTLAVLGAALAGLGVARRRR